jgi:prophage DNA circulation protein
MFGDAFDAVRPNAPDDVDASLAELQAIVTDRLSDAIEVSPRIATVTVADTTPAMILAWELYGDVGREAEIIRLNAVANPATLRGDYQVLT